jgi:hypothetical protein
VTSRLADDLLKQGATSVAARLVPTQDRVSVIMPRGSFESFIPFAESNSWDRYLSSVEAVKENRNPKQEAFRQYALGVAKEGLAYSTSIEDRTRALDLLREAVAHYETAMRSNPGEEIFSKAYSSLFSVGSFDAPLNRANSSLIAFEAWSGATGGAKNRTMVSSAKSTKTKDVLTNSMLIEMSKAGLTEENLILAIDAAETVDFDTTPPALIDLAKAGVSRNVIASMQKKQAKR